MPAPADRAAPQVLPPQERSEAHRPPCSTRRETSRACHPSAPAERARTSIGHTPRAREGVSEQGETHRPPAAGLTLFDYLYLRAGRKGEVPLGVLRAGGGPSVLRDCQLLRLVLHHLGGHGDNAACLAKLLVAESPARSLLGDGGGAKRLGGAPRWQVGDEGVLVTGVGLESCISAYVMKPFRAFCAALRRISLLSLIFICPRDRAAANTTAPVTALRNERATAAISQRVQVSMPAQHETATASSRAEVKLGPCAQLPEAGS